MIHARFGHRIGRGSTFLDKDFVSPAREPETPQCGSRAFGPGHGLEESPEERQSDRSTMMVGGHEVRPVDVLLSLEKKPVESYFEGLKRKPTGRKKVRQAKKKSLNVWDASPGARSEGWIPASGAGAAGEREQGAAEDRAQGVIVQGEMRHYERMVRHKQENISMRQRLAEKKYLEQLTNLAETWLGVMERRSHLRNGNLDDFVDCQRPTFRRPPPGKRYNRIDISILSRKFWSDDEAKGPMTSEAEEQESVVDDLGEGFGEKLVFVDDEE